MLPFLKKFENYTTLVLKYNNFSKKILHIESV